ncbi:hypothetical protein Tco_0499478 [Tanacetum coccineum]
MVNGKRAYELNGKFLDDLRDNAFSGTNGEDAVKHIEYFLKIVDLINLPNVNYERLRLSVFPISLVGNASKWFDEFKDEIFRIETNLFDYETPLCTEFKEFNFLLKVDPELFTHDIERTKTYKDYENELNNELESHGPKLEYHMKFDYECYNELADSNLKEEDLKQKAIYEKSWGDASQSIMNFYAWLKRNHIQGPYVNYYSNFMHNEEHENKDKRGLIDNQKRALCNIRIFEMIKYSFGEYEEYVAIKEHEYNDLKSTNEDACCTYQEIFRRMDEGLDINALALSDRHPTYHETPSDQVNMDDPNITMEEYIRLEEEKARRRAIVFDDTLTSEATLSCEPTPTISYFDDLDFFKDFENEFPAIIYNDALTSKLDLLTKPILNPQHIDEFNLKDETSLSECDEEEQNILNFNDLFRFNIIYPNDSKSNKDNDNDKVDIEHSSRYLFVKPLPDVINTDVGDYAHGLNKLLETGHDTSNKFFKTETFIKGLNFNIMT